MTRRTAFPAFAAAHPNQVGRSLLLLFVVPWAAACGSLDLAPTAPPGFDLNGSWSLVEDASESAPSHRRLRARGGMLAFVTQDFPVLQATTMQIEQGRDSMGVRYDGGDYRDVSWGERNRGLWAVRAGWHEGDLIILSDAADANARETLSLSGDGRRLTVNVRVSSGSQDIDITRVFRRTAAGG